MGLNAEGKGRTPPRLSGIEAAPRSPRSRWCRGLSRTDDHGHDRIHDETSIHIVTVPARLGLDSSVEAVWPSV